MKNSPLRGVNLGGWLVLEKWMTPSLFRGTRAIDEYTFMSTVGAKDKLRHHRDTFITEEDFKWLSQNGITAIRLPVGYWIIHPDGPYEAGIEYVDWAFRMAEAYQLKVLIDLHGAQGSQNGHDHSGRAGLAGWFKSNAARMQTIETLVALHKRYRESPAYWGLQLLNEPRVGLLHLKLRAFYRRAARQIDGDARIVYHDAFTPRLLSGALRGDNRAVMDIHLYHMTSIIGRLYSAEQFIDRAGSMYARLLRRLSRQQPVIIGEWSIVLKGESLRHLNSKQALKLMQTFGTEQLAVYEAHSAGWFYWSYKTEGRGIWNFRSLIEDGILTMPAATK